MNSTNLLTLHLRREPAKDRTPGKFDVCAYYNEACTLLKAYWSWDSTSKPTRRNKSVVIGCARRPIVWH